MDIENFFPFSDFRKNQKEVLNELTENIESYNYFFLEAPTGFGKSAIAYTLAKWIFYEYRGLTNICVQNKFLQEQYLHDFSDLRMIKGRGNYTCLENQKFNCDCGRCTVDDKFTCPYKPRREKNRDKYGVTFDWERIKIPCLYWFQKERAIRNNITLHNYSYYLLESNYIHDFTKRYLGVFDEAHLIEKRLMDFVGLTISEGMLKRVGLGDVIIPNHQTISEWIPWLEELQSRLTVVNFNEFLFVEEIGYPLEYIKAKQAYERILRKVNELLNTFSIDIENWVFVVNRKWQKDSITFKPVTIGNYSPCLFNFTNKNLLMSATILDAEKLKNYLGIKEDVKYIKIEDSTFPVENRPFIQAHIGKASRNTLDLYLLRLVKKLDSDYIPQKSKDKGVIHTHTNYIAKYIMENSKNSALMMSTTGNNQIREKTIEEFFDSIPPKIMVSPSMGLGVDLKDDRCRWQIITKIPYPDMSDPQVAKRMKIDPDWYDYATITALIQTYGRGCRSETDFCETFCTDSMFAWLYHKNHKMVPSWFREAITTQQRWEQQNPEVKVN